MNFHYLSYPTRDKLLLARTAIKKILVHMEIPEIMGSELDEQVKLLKIAKKEQKDLLESAKKEAIKYEKELFAKNPQ